MPVTIREVAKAAGVSIATVSRALNDHSVVTAETRRKVEQAVTRLAYHPNDIARSMARGRTATIGLVLNDLSNPFNSQAAEAVITTAEQRGFRTILALASFQPDRTDAAIRFLLRQRVDGFLFGQVHRREPGVEGLMRKGHPAMVFNRRLRLSGAPFVGCNNAEGGRAVGRHLAGLGHRHTAVITGPRDLSTVTERVGGYREAIRTAGLPDPIVVNTGYRSGDAVAAMEALFKQHRTPTAVFATTDSMALELLAFAAARRVRVSDDLAVVGFDDIEIASHPLVRLTTVAQQIANQAVRAAERLLIRIGGRRDTAGVELLPAPLIVRRTCGGGE